MSKIIKSQKMIKEGLWTIELMDGTIIQCTNNDDFKLKYNQNKEDGETDDPGQDIAIDMGR